MTYINPTSPTESCGTGERPPLVFFFFLQFLMSSLFIIAYHPPSPPYLPSMPLWLPNSYRIFLKEYPNMSNSILLTKYTASLIWDIIEYQTTFKTTYLLNFRKADSINLEDYFHLINIVTPTFLCD